MTRVEIARALAFGDELRFEARLGGGARDGVGSGRLERVAQALEIGLARGALRLAPGHFGIERPNAGNCRKREKLYLKEFCR